MRKIIALYLLSIISASVDYNSEIQPIFDDSCGNCHLGSSSGGLNLSNYSNLMSSNTVIPGNHQASILYDRITRSESEQGDMPPSGSLSDEQIDLIAQWIDEGALEFPIINECDEGYSYYEDVPQNTCIVLDGSNCFYTQDIEALQDISNLNDLNFDETPLYLGFQNWSNGRLTRLIVGNNSNGGNIILSDLPESIGNLGGLVQLYIDDNELQSLPESIGNLTNLLYLIANFNNLQSLPDSIGDLENLIWLDVGYNQIEYVPSSIGSLSNLIYLWLFDNQISYVPETVCNLDLNWDGYDINFVPYFGIGGNLLCDSQNIPDCVANSANFNISLDQFYYSFTVVHEQDCPDASGDANLDGELNVLDVVTLVNYITGNLELTDEAINTADVNSDGNIDVLDVVTIVNLILNN
tara:strand:+ start:641 stop:1870 length:1230 start_codon:yes stop_codon:yes gene_type:complete